MKVVNKEQTLLKFYDILKADNYEFDTSEINLYLLIIGFIINSNAAANVDQKLLKRY